jgi:hypothetical protein
MYYVVTALHVVLWNEAFRLVWGRGGYSEKTLHTFYHVRLYGHGC